MGQSLSSENTNRSIRLSRRNFAHPDECYEIGRRSYRAGCFEADPEDQSLITFCTQFEEWEKRELQRREKLNAMFEKALGSYDNTSSELRLDIVEAFGALDMSLLVSILQYAKKIPPGIDFFYIIHGDNSSISENYVNHCLIQKMDDSTTRILLRPIKELFDMGFYSNPLLLDFKETFGDAKLNSTLLEQIVMYADKSFQELSEDHEVTRIVINNFEPAEGLTDLHMQLDNGFYTVTVTKQQIVITLPRS